jgi:hypothetical protein
MLADLILKAPLKIRRIGEAISNCPISIRSGFFLIFAKKLHETGPGPGK